MSYILLPWCHCSNLMQVRAWAGPSNAFWPNTALNATVRSMILAICDGFLIICTSRVHKLISHLNISSPTLSFCGHMGIPIPLQTIDYGPLSIMHPGTYAKCTSLSTLCSSIIVCPSHDYHSRSPLKHVLGGMDHQHHALNSIEERSSNLPSIPAHGHWISYWPLWTWWKTWMTSNPLPSSSRI